NEKSLAVSLADVRDAYKAGLTLSDFLRDCAELETANQPLTGTTESKAALSKIKKAIENVNDSLNEKEKQIKKVFDDAAKEITTALAELKTSQQQLEAKLNAKKTDLQKKGLQGSVAEFNRLLTQKSTLVQDISK